MPEEKPAGQSSELLGSGDRPCADVEVSSEEIARLAYALWEERGGGSGRLVDGGAEAYTVKGANPGSVKRAVVETWLFSRDNCLTQVPHSRNAAPANKAIPFEALQLGRTSLRLARRRPSR